jgi:diguanylate cyclase (GGDEF)-like protein
VLLRGGAEALASSVRGGDLIARHGGDEFDSIVTNVGADEAAAVGERMRRAVERVDLPTGRAQVTIGCVAAPGRASLDGAWAAADAALYAGKRAGGDRVVSRVLGSRDGRLVLSRRGHVIPRLSADTIARRPIPVAAAL